MHSRRLEDFLSILEAGSIRAAARRHGLSQPALTKSLRKLESELGVELLARTPTGVLPTTYGKSLARRARVVRAEMRLAHEEIEAMTGASPGSVAFGIGTASANLLVPPTIRRLRRLHPELHIRISEGLPHNLVPMVRDRTLDFALGARLPGVEDTAVSFRALFYSTRTVVVRPHHPLAGATTITELAHAEWLSLPALPSIDAESAWAGNVRQMVECESYHSFSALLAESDMIGLVSRRLVADAVARGALVELSLVDPLPSFRVGLYQRVDATPIPAAAAAIKIVTGEARRVFATPRTPENGRNAGSPYTA